jgi:hypothetical protein
MASTIVIYIFEDNGSFKLLYWKKETISLLLARIGLVVKIKHADFIYLSLKYNRTNCLIFLFFLREIKIKILLLF